MQEKHAFAVVQHACQISKHRRRQVGRLFFSPLAHAMPHSRGKGVGAEDVRPRLQVLGVNLLDDVGLRDGQHVVVPLHQYVVVLPSAVSRRRITTEQNTPRAGAETRLDNQSGKKRRRARRSCGRLIEHSRERATAAPLAVGFKVYAFHERSKPSTCSQSLRFVLFASGQGRQASRTRTPAAGIGNAKCIHQAGDAGLICSPPKKVFLFFRD